MTVRAKTQPDLCIDENPSEHRPGDDVIHSGLSGFVTRHRVEALSFGSAGPFLVHPESAAQQLSRGARMGVAVTGTADEETASYRAAWGN